MSGRNPIRHGEVLLLPVPRAPDGDRQGVTVCIVGHSESGHHHVLDSDVVFHQIVATNGDLYVDLDAPTPLRHQKEYQQHRELTVPRGVWRILRKAEFDVRAAPAVEYDAPVAPAPISATDWRPSLYRPVRD